MCEEIKKVKCELCGSMFVPKYNGQRYCEDIHQTSCSICGSTIRFKAGDSKIHHPTVCLACASQYNPFRSPLINSADLLYQSGVCLYEAEEIQPDGVC